jgi:acyl-CoA reductase-like NAD-dependent aldehyde dehydrogenase
MSATTLAAPSPSTAARSLVAPRVRELARRLREEVTLAPGAHDEIAVHAPFTGEHLGSVPRGTPRDVEHALATLRAAQPAWAARPVAERARIVRRFHDLLLDRQDECLDLAQLEAGKARRDAFEELGDVAIVARYYAHRAEGLLAPRRRRGLFPGLTRVTEHHHPVGVVGFLVPWNYPITLAVTDALPALLAGNAALVKPDHQTSLTALWLVALLREAGLPRDACVVVTGEGPELGPSIVGGVDFVMFTGSTRTGRVIAGQAAARLVGCSLELGGKNPMVVLPDADLDAAAAGLVRGAYANAGQLCESIERLYVPRGAYDAFVSRAVARLRSVRLGAALDFSADVGSLTSRRQLDAVTRHVEDARAKGATVLAGGRPRPDVGPLFYEPTLLAGAAPGMELYAEETFGPVVAVYPYDAVDDAVAMANDTRYGLNASVWGRDTRRAAAVATRIRAGTVNVNEVYAAAWGSVDAPIGGMKESGLGRRHGAEGLLKYTETQTVAVQRGTPVAGPSQLDGARYQRVMTRALRLLARTPGLR